MSLDAFLDLIFEHPVDGKGGKEWYWRLPIDLRVDLDGTHVVDLYGQLFFRSDELLDRYSKEKLEQGCWFMMSSCSLDFVPEELLCSDNLPVELKEKLIKSMYHLYEKLYFDEPLATSSYMWWDHFARAYCVHGMRGPIKDEAQRRVQEATFSTLVRILSLDSEICQGAALHGLNHLGHPDTERVIGDFIRKNRRLTKEQIEYAKRCITGDNL